MSAGEGDLKAEQEYYTMTCRWSRTCCFTSHIWALTLEFTYTQYES